MSQPTTTEQPRRADHIGRTADPAKAARRGYYTGATVSYHHNPIEPDDWANGPDQSEPDCPYCDGIGTIDGDDDLEHTCPKCDGSGYLPFDHCDED